jgi:hypothetical protein
MPEPIEAGNELGVEHGDFPVEGEGLRFEFGECFDYVREASGMVSVIPTDQPDPAVVLEREYPPTGAILFVDASFVWKGSATSVACMRAGTGLTSPTTPVSGGP